MIRVELDVSHCYQQIINQWSSSEFISIHYQSIGLNSSLSLTSTYRFSWTKKCWIFMKHVYSIIECDHHILLSDPSFFYGKHSKSPRHFRTTTTTTKKHLLFFPNPSLKSHIINRPWFNTTTSKSCPIQLNYKSNCVIIIDLRTSTSVLLW